MLKFSWTISLVPLVLVAVIGCGSSSGGLDLHQVTGTVTFAGQPIKEGRILFRAMEGDQRAFSSPITEGRYAVETLPGTMRVEITASRIVPGKFDTSNPGEKVPVGEMYIPARYNAKSELTVEVKPGGGTVDFTLDGKK